MAVYLVPGLDAVVNTHSWAVHDHPDRSGCGVSNGVSSDRTAQRSKVRAVRLRRQRDMSDLDDAIFHAAASGMQRILEAGGSKEMAERVAADAVRGSFTTTAPRVVDHLIRKAPSMLRDKRRNQRRVRRRLRSHWGKALDLYLMYAVCAEEVGREFDKEHRPPDGEWFDPVHDALLGLHARACRTAVEVYHLLSDGLPMGALARSRTLHEIAVTAIIIAKYGRRSEHADLAERFLDHYVVANYKDAVVYQENCEALGYEPFSDADMAVMKENRDHAVARYGKLFKELYGWAVGLVGTHAPNFRELEQLAGISHLRGHYSWASHEVHSDAKGWALNIREWGDRLYRETSYSNSGLADPGQMALISLHQTTVNLLFSVEEIPPRSILAGESLGLLLDKARHAFGAAHEVVETYNEELQRKQARWGRPYGWWRRVTWR